MYIEKLNMIKMCYVYNHLRCNLEASGKIEDAYLTAQHLKSQVYTQETLGINCHKLHKTCKTAN